MPHLPSREFAVVDVPSVVVDSDQLNLPAKTVDAKPIFDAEFAALMRTLGPFERHPTLAVAVSGGPDSLALTLLAAHWAKVRHGQVIGLTVDHGLRTESAKEACQVGHWLKAHGVEHHILTWEGPKSKTGLQQQARDARYERLGVWCRKAGILHLLTAHHQQDQAETVALRTARQSGPRGLAAMAAIRDLHGSRLLRPLLVIDKQRLMATLNHLGQAWIDDPSNRNPIFTRSRLRQKGIDVRGLAAQALHLGRQRQATDQQLNAILAQFVTVDPLGFARMPASVLGDLPADIGNDLVTKVLMMVGGSIYPPRRQSIAILLNAMRGPRTFGGKTLAHCQILQQKNQWLFCSETKPTQALALLPYQWHFWNNKFLIRSRHRQNGLSVRQLGDLGWSMRDDLCKFGPMRDVPPVVKRNLPSIWQGKALLAVPHLGLFHRSLPPSVLDLKFRPRTPLANAPFAAHM